MIASGIEPQALEVDPITRPMRRPTTQVVCRISDTVCVNKRSSSPFCLNSHVLIQVSRPSSGEGRKQREDCRF